MVKKEHKKSGAPATGTERKDKTDMSEKEKDVAKKFGKIINMLPEDSVPMAYLTGIIDGMALANKIDLDPEPKEKEDVAS